VVSKSLVRELAPVLVALIVGGRIGAGTAERAPRGHRADRGAALDGRRQ
jgi:hypothetical protein